MRRRGDVLAAAVGLWRAHGAEELTLVRMADTAGVATRTVSNLIGGVEAVKIAPIEELPAKLYRSVATFPAGGGSAPRGRSRRRSAVGEVAR